MRPASHSPASAASGAPRSGSRPVQFGIAVRRKPATLARAKPNTISWMCQTNGGNAPGSAAPPEYDSSQAGTATADQRLAARKNGRKPAENTAHRGAIRWGAVLTQVNTRWRAGPTMLMDRRQTMANITRYNPIEDLFNDVSKGFWVKPFAFPAETELKMKLDVKEDEKSYTVRADIPGVKKEDIHVDIDGAYITLRAESRQEKEEKKGEKLIHSERSYGMVSRSFQLPGRGRFADREGRVQGRRAQPDAAEEGERRRASASPSAERLLPLRPAGRRGRRASLGAVRRRARVLLRRLRGGREHDRGRGPRRLLRDPHPAGRAPRAVPRRKAAA